MSDNEKYKEITAVCEGLRVQTAWIKKNSLVRNSVAAEFRSELLFQFDFQRLPDFDDSEFEERGYRGLSSERNTISSLFSVPLALYSAA